MIKKSYFDPLTNASYSKKPELKGGMGAFFVPAMYLIDDVTEILLEHVADDEISSLSINIDLLPYAQKASVPARGIVALQLQLAIKIREFLDKHLRQKVVYKIDTNMENMVCLEMPDYSALPHLQTENLADEMLNIAIRCTSPK
jgi:hypothetical protein